MGHLNGFQLFSAVIMVASILNSVTGQISTACTTSMINSFTPCANFVTGSTNNNGLTPSSSCCDSLESLMSTSMDCACLLITANVPLQLSFINQALALLLPQACNLNEFTAQCKGAIYVLMQ
jgi:hypothetical protein